MKESAGVTFFGRLHFFCPCRRQCPRLKMMASEFADAIFCFMAYSITVFLRRAEKYFDSISENGVS